MKIERTLFHRTRSALDMFIVASDASSTTVHWVHRDSSMADQRIEQVVSLPANHFVRANIVARALSRVKYDRLEEEVRKFQAEHPPTNVCEECGRGSLSDDQNDQVMQYPDGKFHAICLPTWKLRQQQTLIKS